MKILFLCHNLTGGGAERVAANVAEGLSNKGHDVVFLTDLRDPITYKMSSKVRLVQIDVLSKNVFGRRWRVFRQLCRMLKSEKPDIIISIMGYYAVEARLATWLSYRCPIIQSEHNSFERPDYAPLSFRGKLEKFYFNYLYDHITVLTQADLKYLNGRFKNISVMINPLFLEPVDCVGEKQRTILAVGRLDDWEYKGFDLLISVWNDIAFKYSNWVLKIVGGGDLKNLKLLQGQVRQDVDNIEFKSYTDNIVQEYREASVFVLSSRYEGFGLVLTEAMSQGCACIACDYHGRQAEIVDDGVTGLLCKVNDKDDLKAKIEQLLDDADLRFRLQNNAIKALDRFSCDTIVQKWDTLVRKVCGAR